MGDKTAALELWPDLPWQDWESTATTLHMWMQIVGKTRLALTPLVESLVERSSVRHRPWLVYFCHALRRRPA